MNWFRRRKNREDDQQKQRLEKFRQLIVADDPHEIEGARDWVQPEDVAPLLALYWELDTWPQKRALIEIVQDRHAPDIERVMLDFLRAPVSRGDEMTELAKAIALGFIHEKYDNFMGYYNDRALLARTVNQVLQEHGLELVAAPPPLPQAKPQPIPTDQPPNARLMAAAVQGELTAVQQAVADGANVNVQYASGGDYAGCSALMMALMRKQFDVADYLIDQGANVNHKRPAKHTDDKMRGQTPLWWAANHGHLELAAKLLEKGADLDTPDHFGSTPLSTAASSGHLPMVRFLVELGADIHSTIYDGRKPFNLAVTHGHKKVAEFLMSQGNMAEEAGSSGYSSLMIAAENGFYDLAKTLIEKGADVNRVHPGPGIYTGLRGWTPLIFAVNAGYVRLVKLFIKAGADVNYVVPERHTFDGKLLPAQPVIAFARGKRADSIRAALIEAGAKA